MIRIPRHLAQMNFSGAVPPFASSTNFESSICIAGDYGPTHS